MSCQPFAMTRVKRRSSAAFDCEKRKDSYMMIKRVDFKLAAKRQSSSKFTCQNNHGQKPNIAYVKRLSTSLRSTQLALTKSSLRSILWNPRRVAPNVKHKSDGSKQNRRSSNLWTINTTRKNRRFIISRVSLLYWLEIATHLAKTENIKCIGIFSSRF